LKILGIIPAREGSKRVKNKNFRPFAGKTLVDIAILHCLESSLLTDIVLSSDSDEVLNIGRKYPEIHSVKRPFELSDDHSPAIDYVHHVLSVMEPLKGYEYDIIVVLQPSSPFRSGEHIDNTISLLFCYPEKESAVSVVKVNHMVHPVKLKRLKADILLPYIEEESGRYAADQLEEIYVRNCAVYAIRKDSALRRNSVISPDSVGYIMPPETSVDINNMWDFEFAEFIFKKLHV
jgi:CMP-N,N'-diacetyllegionaminic acid synthase